MYLNKRIPQTLLGKEFVFGWLEDVKCNICEKKISYIYPIVELSVGIIWLASSFLFINTYDSLGFAIIASILLAIAVIDYRHFIIPLELSVFCFLFICIFLVLNGKFINHLDGLLIGTGYLSIILLITWLVTKRQGLGLGDIQLAVILGLWFGDIRILLVIFLSAFIALITWVLISFNDKFDKNRPLPFGSFLSIVSIFIYLLDLSQFSFLF